MIVVNVTAKFGDYEIFLDLKNSFSTWRRISVYDETFYIWIFMSSTFGLLSWSKEWT
jgi:hypothetical protein